MQASDGRGPGGWRASALLFVAALLVYSANGREIGAVDTIPNMILPVAVLRGDGLVLNRFASMVRDGKKLHVYVKQRGDELLSRYPVLPALLALPLTAVQLHALDRAFPDWERDPEIAFWWLRTMAKNSSALFAALTVALLHRLLRRLGLGAAALPATLAAGFGSDLWMVGSQSPWQHGPAALFVTLALLLVAPGASAPRWRLAAAGLSAAAAVCARPTSVLFAAPLALWAAVALGRRAAWLLAPAALVAALLLGSNLHFFDNLLGGLGEIESQGHAQHGLTGSVTSEPFWSIAGTLLSPSRGLLVFSPWVLIGLAALPATARRIARVPPLAATLLGLLPFGLAISLYGVWWGGWTFGPRYWTEAMPLFAVLLGFALVWARERSRATLHASYVAIAFSIALQAVGALCYPSTWNSFPVTVDLAHERLWDWRDTEIRRCLEEGPVWPASFELLRRRFAG